MAFIFYQICQTNRCNVMYPFRFPLSVISCSGVCLLTDVEKQNTGFFCDNYGNKKFVSFEKMINGEASNFICQKEN